MTRPYKDPWSGIKSSQNVQYSEEPILSLKIVPKDHFQKSMKSSTLWWQFGKFCYVRIPCYKKRVALTQRRYEKGKILEEEEKIKSTRADKLKFLWGSSLRKLLTRHPCFDLTTFLHILNINVRLFSYQIHSHNFTSHPHGLLFLSFLPPKPAQISFMP